MVMEHRNPDRVPSGRPLPGGEDWLNVVTAARTAGEPCVLVTVADVAGSTPREAGTKMVVFPDRVAGTIGGGTLEYKALEIARGLLTEAAPRASVREFPLGPALGQCCGGHVSVLFEPMAPVGTPLFLFGAGHVGQALAGVLADLPFRVTWIDQRAEAFPAVIPPNVRVRCVDGVEAEVGSAPPGALFLIMTHSHALDMVLVEAVLERGDAAYCGLIGSRTKRAKFVRRLAKRGLDEAGLTCPIGIDGVPGKHPKEIAVAVAAQLLQVRAGLPPSVPTPPPGAQARSVHGS